MCVDKNNYATEVCSGSEAGSYLRLIDCCITLGSRVIENKKKSVLEFRAGARTP